MKINIVLDLHDLLREKIHSEYWIFTEVLLKIRGALQLADCQRSLIVVFSRGEFMQRSPKTGTLISALSRLRSRAGKQATCDLFQKRLTRKVAALLIDEEHV